MANIFALDNAAQVLPRYTLDREWPHRAIPTAALTDARARPAAPAAAAAPSPSAAAPARS